MINSLSYPKQPPKQPPKFILSNYTERTASEVGLWHTHDPAIFQDPISLKYYIYCTGAICQRSTDLIHWEMVGKVVDSPPIESSEWVGGTDIWAPDIVKVGDEYRLYCSNSTWGVRQSCIFLAVADNPEGPFIPRGCVLKTTDKMPVNAIDANIITDVKTGEMYMAYGSFWGGCYLLQLDPKTGLAVEKGIGTCIAARPQWTSSAIEGPYLIHNPDTDYYYLFVSYGSLKADYNIRVGRSKNIKGPYLDANGNCLINTEDLNNSTGFMITCGYRWNDGTAYMAPGHNSVLNSHDNQWYLVYHIREHNFKTEPEPSTMQIRKLYWTPDGWPVASAQPFSGEKTQSIPESAFLGNYERIRLTPSIPQGIQCSIPMKLDSNNSMESCSILGTWEITGENSIRISYGNTHEYLIASPAWDHELNKPTIILTGKTNAGVAIWAKKI